MIDIDARQFRSALGGYTTGVTIITALDDTGQPIGLTANSFASVSLNPPLVLWSIDKDSPLFDKFMQAGHYAVHVLRHDQQYLSHNFSDDDIDKFAGVTYERGITGLPLLTDYSTLFQCKVQSRHEEGDHVILVGRVISIDDRSEKPLVFHKGKYRRLED
ncbi:MAG: flavin reductase family protein [Woeseia sp.]